MCHLHARGNVIAARRFLARGTDYARDLEIGGKQRDGFALAISPGGYP